MTHEINVSSRSGYLEKTILSYHFERKPRIEKDYLFSIPAILFKKMSFSLTHLASAADTIGLEGSCCSKGARQALAAVKFPSPAWQHPTDATTSDGN
jgi:hypothetical protein